MVSPVQFTKAVSVILPEKSARAARDRRNRVAVNSVLELGPHSALQGPLRQVLQKNGQVDNVAYAAAILRNKDAIQSILEAVGELWMRGQLVNLARVNVPHVGLGSVRALPDLPNYPWK